MANLNGFNANDHEPTGFDLLPAGRYVAMIVNSEMKETKAGDGEFLKLEWQIAEPEKFRNRKLFENLNLQNKSQKAVEIARGTLSAICRAVGIMTPQDSSELHNRPIEISVGVRKDDKNEEQNCIKSYKAIGGGTPKPEPVGVSTGGSDRPKGWD